MATNSLYDVQVDLSSCDGGVPKDKLRDGMRVRLFGTKSRRAVSVPEFAGSIWFVNDNDADVMLKRGVAAPVTVSQGEIVHVMFDPATFGMRVVR